MGSRKTRKPSEAEDHDPATMLRENDRERFAHLRAGGMSLRNCAKAVDVAESTVDLWLKSDTATGRAVRARIEYLRELALEELRLSSAEFAVKRLRIAELAVQNGKFDVADRIYREYEQRALDRESSNVIDTDGEDMSDTDIEKELL